MSNVNVIKNAIVLSVKKYSLTDETTGEVIKGLTCYYIPSVIPAEDKDKNGKGYVPVKVGFRDLAIFNNFVQVPGLYDFEYEVVAGVGGKPALRYTDVKYVKGLVNSNGWTDN